MLVLPITYEPPSYDESQQSGLHKLRPDAYSIVISTMLFPDNDEMRQKFVEAHIAWLEQNNRTATLAGQPDKFDLFDFVASLPQDSRNGIFEKRIRNGMLVGTAVKIIVQYSYHAPEREVGKNKGLFLANHEYLSSKTDLLSPNMLKNIWRDFRSVSHLWCAYVSLIKDGMILFDDGTFQGFESECLPQMFINSFLAYAVIYSAFLLTEKGRRNKMPIMNLEDFWYPPEGVVSPIKNLYIPTPTEASLQALKSYRA